MSAATSILSRRALLPLAALAVAGAATAPPALAQHGGAKADRVVAHGTCSAGSTWKLKLKHDASRIEVEFEVDQNRNGVPWRVALSDNGHVVKRASFRTAAPSGSFTARALIVNRVGRDVVRGVARRSGETCRAIAAI